MVERTDGDAPAGRMTSGPRALTAGASVVFLAGLAVVWPVLEVLGRNPEFFVARASPVRDAVLVALTVGLVLPLSLGGLVAAAVALDRRVGAAVHVIVAALLGGLFVYGALSQVVGEAAPLGVVAAIVAVGAAVGYRRSPAAWGVVRWGAVVPVVALGLFVLAWPSSRVVAGGAGAEAIDLEVAQPVPVTVVVFDELSTASLLRSPDEIDATRFPNLARFAEDAVWYRNATTVSDSTTLAVPAVFTGQLTSAGQLPVAGDHPVSLFTLLGRTHDVRAVEPVTELCPPDVCTGEDLAQQGPSGPSALASDVSLIGAHVLLPEVLTRDLPRIDQAWGDFGRALEADPGDQGDGHDLRARMDRSVERDRRDDFAGVVAPADDRPVAHLLHTLLPHVPYRILPTGQTVHPTPMPGVDADEVWRDQRLAHHAAARYLLQAGFADRMLGELLADLREAGLYRGGMVVVTSDHGVSFEEGTTRRRLSEDNLPQIVSVPLLVKYPDDPGGRIDRRPAETIDIVPTVLDVLGATPPGDLDGTSLLTDAPADRERTTDGFHGPITYAMEDADPWPVARTYRRLFGDGWDGVYRHGPHADLIGQQVAELPVAGSGAFIGVVDRLDEIRSSRPDSDPIVGVVSGGLGYAHGTQDDERHVAVAFDGRVVAVGRTYEHEADRAPFLALVPPEAYEGGVDDVALFTVERGPGGGWELAPVLLP